MCSCHGSGGALGSALLAAAFSPSVASDVSLDVSAAVDVESVFDKVDSGCCCC